MCNSVEINWNTNKLACIGSLFFISFVVSWGLYYDDYLISAIILWILSGIFFCLPFCSLICCKTVDSDNIEIVYYNSTNINVS